MYYWQYLLRIWNKILIKLNDWGYIAGKFLFESWAKFLGYPDNFALIDEMKLSEYDLEKWRSRDFLFKDILLKYTRQLDFIKRPGWNALSRNIDLEKLAEKQIPTNFFEVLFGVLPEINPITRVHFIDSESGYYNFYVRDYLNAVRLPDYISEYLQISMNCDLDYSDISLVREALFVIVWVMHELLQLRALMGMFIFINPYIFPWVLLTLVTDWVEEFTNLFLPQLPLFDINHFAAQFLIGLSLDSLNNLILTFPYLPSEGQRLYIYSGKKQMPAIVFRGLPKLWYKYGIPNVLRQFWYYNRPDILKFMQDSYKDRDIQLLPDEIIEKLNSQQTLPVSEIDQIPIPIVDVDYIYNNFHYLFNHDWNLFNHNWQFDQFFKNILNLIKIFLN